MTPSKEPLSDTASEDPVCKIDNSNPQQGTELMAASEQTTQVKGANEAPNNRANTMRSPPTKKDSRKLFVGGLPSDITEDEFRDFFEQFGEVVDSVVMFDRETHRSRGFGFVTFQNSEVATKLLNMSVEGEAGDKAPEESADGPRVGRLVMRGKTCEVKAAEPKEASRSNRRGYQNQGGSSGAPKRYDKAYPQAGRQPSLPPVSQYHDPHYMAGHQYPMVSPSYYPAYHPGMYHEAAAYHPATMYAPVAHNAPVHNEGFNQSFGSPMLASHVNGVPYAEAPQEIGHGYAAYGHPHMVQQGYPVHPNVYAQPVQGGEHPAPRTSSSVMHPAAPGLPTKDD